MGICAGSKRASPICCGLRNYCGNHEYAIERDEGLVGDLKTYAQTP